jgi:hypothetical protein
VYYFDQPNSSITMLIHTGQEIRTDLGVGTGGKVDGLVAA